jgi:hypothetical protein
VWSRNRLLLLGLACAVLAVAAPAIGALFPFGSPIRLVTLPLGMLGLVGAFAFSGGGLWAKGERRGSREKANERS